MRMGRAYASGWAGRSQARRVEAPALCAPSGKMSESGDAVSVRRSDRSRKGGSNVVSAALRGHLPLRVGYEGATFPSWEGWSLEKGRNSTFFRVGKDALRRSAPGSCARGVLLRLSASRLEKSADRDPAALHDSGKLREDPSKLEKVSKRGLLRRVVLPKSKKLKLP